MDFSQISILLYFSAFVVEALGLKKSWRGTMPVVWGLTVLALALHGTLLHHGIDLRSGQNLSVYNLFSMTFWGITLFWMVCAVFWPVAMLGIVILPLDALSILLMQAIQKSQMIIHTAAEPATLFHVLWAILTLCVLGIAALFAVLLAVQERALQRKFMVRFLMYFPSLEKTAQLLYRLILVGFILLSVLLVSSVVTYLPLFSQYPVLLNKTILVIIAWCVFGVLLLGRRFFGWRCNALIYGTIVGVLVLMGVYFGGQIFLRAFM